MIALPVAVSVLLVVLVIAFFAGRTMRPAGLPHSEEEKRRTVNQPSSVQRLDAPVIHALDGSY